MKSSDLNGGYWTDTAFHKQLANTAALFVPKYLYLLNPTFPVAKEILEALPEQRCQSQRQGSLKDTKQRTIEVQSRVDVGTLSESNNQTWSKRLPDEDGFKGTGSFTHRRGKKDSLKRWWAEQRMSFYGYCGSNVQKLHRSQQSHRLKKKMLFN